MAVQSVNVELDHTCEWVVEKYMETDYSVLSDKEFKETLLNYSTYLFSNQLKDFVSKKPRKVVASSLLNTEEWELFKIPDLFTISGTGTTPIEDLEYSGSGKYPYVTTQSTNNGVKGFFAKMTEDCCGVLTIDSAIHGYCSYQSMPFSASDHVEKLTPRFNMDIYVAMFFVTIFNLEQYRYNYGRKCSQTRLKQAQIRLPIDSNGEPDYDFMREYISHLEYSSNLESC